MPFIPVRNDITKMKVDAVVNAANNSLLGGGGVDGAIHKAAGKQLLEECKTLGGCETGDAKITGGYNMDCKYIIHTVGPVWYGGSRGEKELLVSAYRKSLELAEKYKCDSVAFPLISAGAYGYPKTEALKIATDTIRDFLIDSDMTVYLVVFDKDCFRISEKIYADIKEYIDDTYVDRRTDAGRNYMSFFPSASKCSDSVPELQEQTQACFSRSIPAAEDLAGIINAKDESFSEMLIRLIDERGMTDAQCYKKANIDRKLFSKIKNDKQYRPSKQTALSFAIALELPLYQTKEMLMKAGYALSHSVIFDIIVEYFINMGNYNIFDINEALFSFDQPVLS